MRQAPGWHEDILGPDFAAAALDLPGKARATLVRHVPAEPVVPPAGGAAPPLSDTVVLHLHGWSDYFFHADLAQHWARLGAAFFAVDLRNYGRNLIPERAWPGPAEHWAKDPEIAAYIADEWSDYASLDLAESSTDPERRPGYVPDIARYDEEIAAALRVMGGLHPGRRLVVSGHSMGGLVAALWASGGRPGLESSGLGGLGALALNSPWLEFQYSAAARKLLAPILKLRSGGGAGRAKPLNIEMPNFYTLAAAANHGKPQYDLALKPPGSFPVYPDWLYSIFAGHERISEGVDVGVPVLLQTSDQTYQAPRFSTKMASADIVLNVDLIRRAALKIGNTVVLEQIPGATHDVFASAPEQTALAFAGLERFVRGYAVAPGA